jgi:hypothetical protein
MRIATVLGCLFLTVACAEATEPDPTPAQDGGPYNKLDPVADPLAPTKSGEAEGASGRWSSGTVEGKPALVFEQAGSGAAFSISCDDRGGLVLQRRGVLATGGLRMMDVTFAGETRRFAVNELETQQPVLQAIIPYNHELISKLKTVQAPLVVSAGDAGSLTLPASPEIGRLVRNCAQGGGEASGGDPS